MKPESKTKKDFESDKNSRVNRILDRLLKERPSVDEMNAWEDNAPEFPTFPSPAGQEKMKKSKKSPYLP